jgi:ArsR family transcriptional regulator
MEDRNHAESCDFIYVHEELVEKVRRNLPGEDALYDLTELFRIFGDSTRVRILYALFESEMCVCDIARLLGMTQSAISHQLRALKGARLVKSRREGKSVFYALADSHVRTIINQGLEHVSEEGGSHENG